MSQGQVNMYMRATMRTRYFIKTTVTRSHISVYNYMALKPSALTSLAPLHVCENIYKGYMYTNGSTDINLVINQLQ